jgi:hypothetical protein
LCAEAELAAEHFVKTMKFLWWIVDNPERRDGIGEKYENAVRRIEL